MCNTHCKSHMIYVILSKDIVHLKKLCFEDISLWYLKRQVLSLIPGARAILQPSSCNAVTSQSNNSGGKRNENEAFAYVGCDMKFPPQRQITCWGCVCRNHGSVKAKIFKEKAQIDTPRAASVVPSEAPALLLCTNSWWKFTTVPSQCTKIERNQ